MHSRSAFLFLKIAGLIRTTNALSLLFSASSKDQVSDDAFNFQNINNVASTAAIYTIDLSIAGQKFTVSHELKFVVQKTEGRIGAIRQR